jgi:hypothetical protein
MRDSYFFIMSAHMVSIFIIASSFFIIPSLFAIAMWSLHSCIVISFFIMPSLAMPSSFFIMLLFAQPLMATKAKPANIKVFNAVFIAVSPGLVGFRLAISPTLHPGGNRHPGDKTGRHRALSRRSARTFSPE